MYVHYCAWGCGRLHAFVMLHAVEFDFLALFCHRIWRKQTIPRACLAQCTVLSLMPTGHCFNSAHVIFFQPWKSLHCICRKQDKTTWWSHQCQLYQKDFSSQFQKSNAQNWQLWNLWWCHMSKILDCTNLHWFHAVCKYYIKIRWQEVYNLGLHFSLILLLVWFNDTIARTSCGYMSIHTLTTPCCGMWYIYSTRAYHRGYQ